MALAHTISNKTEAAYRRGDLLGKRRALMQAWCDFPAPRTNSVVQFSHVNRETPPHVERGRRILSKPNLKLLESQIANSGSRVGSA
jgi:hypothetical protein